MSHSCTNQKSRAHMCRKDSIHYHKLQYTSTHLSLKHSERIQMLHSTCDMARVLSWLLEPCHVRARVKSRARTRAGKIQHTATHCNKLVQERFNTLLQPATHCNTAEPGAFGRVRDTFRAAPCASLTHQPTRGGHDEISAHLNVRSNIGTHTHIRTHAHTHKHTHTLSHTQTHHFSLTHTHTETHPSLQLLIEINIFFVQLFAILLHTHTHAHTHTQTQTHTLSISLFNTHTHTHTRTHTHADTHTHI